MEDQTWIQADEARARVLDGLDVETFLLCGSEQEARDSLLALLRSFGFSDVDVVFVEQRGPGARVRGRAYVRRPGGGKALGPPPDEAPAATVEKAAGR